MMMRFGWGCRHLIIPIRLPRGFQNPPAFPCKSNSSTRRPATKPPPCHFHIIYDLQCCNKTLSVIFANRLDKTLQDIVYKLVPELFLREMHRRQRFYRDHPVEAAKATPEARGEDTERTIFSPSDIISLSIEYIR